MIRLVCTAFIFFSMTFFGFAAHIKGGEVFYEYLGAGANNTDRFRITVRLFIDCSSTGAQVDADAIIGIFKNSDNTHVPGSPFTVRNSDDNFLRLTAPSPCIVNPSPICYRVRLYATIIELPKDPGGYTVIYQRCCRINGIRNLDPNNSVGASYTCQIHSSNSIAPNAVNSNPQFNVKDTVLVCQRRSFSLNFGASDIDGDSLSYEFCSAYAGGSTGTPVVTRPSAPNELVTLRYAAGFSGQAPLGPDVRINPVTGIIDGVAPAGGDYVVCVCLTEWRNGKAISTHRKDFILRVDANCDFAAADLQPSYITCDGFDFTFKNEAPFSTLIKSYYWDFGIVGRSNDTSTLARPTFVFPDTGTYKVSLIINRGQECSDSATTLLKVYPGFFPGFVANGSCRLNPFVFTDITKTAYGTITKWKWDFGDVTSTSDTSGRANPSWKYNNTGFKRVSLTVESSKGCIGTVTKDSVEVRDKPVVTLPFRDTLICSIDTLRLSAGGGGSFSWRPGPFILNANTASPLVFPKSTTTYAVTVDDNGCINTDSLRVRVVDFVTLSAGSDTTICLTDAVTLNAAGNGLAFSWTPANAVNNASLRRPLTTPAVTTTFQVTASIGKCRATDEVIVTAVPYPRVNAGNDVTICYEDTVQLNGVITGASFNWSPSGALINASSLRPLAFPLRTTPFVLTAFDVQGCPKPKRDTVLVTVEPKINASAGNDTSIVLGQPLQLKASGAEFFQWSPPTGLNGTDIQSPVATLNDNMTYYLKASTEKGCFNFDTINIKVFKTNPDIFVPNAFTPAGPGNRLFRPIPVGITTIEIFQVYNRWGQMVYSSKDVSRGWDGKFGGRDQDAGAYVWVVKGKDFTGKSVMKKGSMVLIR